MNEGQKSVLVTGGAGFIGSHLIDALLTKTSHNVIVVDNFYLGNLNNLEDALSHSERVILYRVDASNFAAMSVIANRHKIDTIFDLAVVPLPTSLIFAEYTALTNFEITSVACELVRMGLARKLVHCSSSEVYGSASEIPMSEEHPLNPITPYAASKLAGDFLVDSYVKTFRVPAVTIRPFNNYGPRQNSREYSGLIPNLINNVLRGTPMTVHGTGAQTRDYVYVRDTADMIVEIALRDEFCGEVFNLGTGVETSVSEIVDLIRNAMGVPDYAVERDQERAGDVSRHCANASRLVQKYGLKALPISQVQISETISWYRKTAI